MELCELIDKNPYRILDISGGSSQVQIYKAVDRAKKAAKIEHIMKGIWEQKFSIESILFSEAQINNAQLLLNDSKERFIYRIFGILEINDQDKLDSFRNIILKHDEIVCNLIDLHHDVEFIDKLLELNNLINNKEFLRLNNYIENYGKFNKTKINYLDYIKYFKFTENSLLKSYIKEIMELEDINVICYFNDFIELSESDFLNEEIKSTFIQKLEEFIQDKFNQIFNNEFSMIKTENITEDDGKSNLITCNLIINLYGNIFNKILIAVSENHTWIPKTSQKRIIEHCVRFYQQLAVDLTWANDYENAKIYIEKAILNSQDMNNYKKLEEVKRSIENSITSIQNSKLEIDDKELTNASLDQRHYTKRNSKFSNKFRFWIVAIIAVIVIGFGINNSSNNNNNISGSTAVDKENSSSYDSKSGLKLEIDNLKGDITDCEGNLRSLKNEMDSLKSDIDSESDNDTKNQYVDEYNSKLADYDSQYSEYEDDINRYNTWVKQYNNEN